MYVEPPYGKDDVTQKLRLMAIGFLDAAEKLSNEMEHGSWDGSFERGQPVLLLGFHATELFIKACLNKLGESVPNSHSLGELNLKLSNVRPELELDVPFGPMPVPSPDDELMELVLASDKNAHQQLRYPADTKGQTWGGVRSFSPMLFSEDLRKLRLEIERVSELVFGSSV